MSRSLFFLTVVYLLAPTLPLIKINHSLGYREEVWTNRWITAGLGKKASRWKSFRSWYWQPCPHHCAFRRRRVSNSSYWKKSGTPYSSHKGNCRGFRL